MNIRDFTLNDYPALQKLYKKSGWFDPETDSKRLIERQITKNPHSILLAIENEEIVGSVTLLFTERLGLFFRLISDNHDARVALLEKGEEIFKKEGYKEVHIIAPLENIPIQNEYERYGFQQGKSYNWFWKKF